MSLTSLDFLLFFSCVLIVYYVVPKMLKTPWLLVVSYYFYYKCNSQYVILVIGTTLITYIAALAMERWKKKKVILISALFLDLISLGYFKYFTFFCDNVNKVLEKMQFSTVDIVNDIVLPVGISFYTFQAISYLVDVYKGKIAVEKNLMYVALYISFFPNLLSGPIERAERMFTQFKEMGKKCLYTYESFSSGLTYMLWGFFLKLVLADRVAMLVNPVFENYVEHNTIALLCGMFGYSIQIYCDFMGYSLTALGCAKALGVELTNNFDTPYFSDSVTEFWRRWHISLSSWLKDYVYIPLGGSRCSALRRDMNIMITFLVSGLWHGAAWNYVVWGGIHGIFQIIEKRTEKIRNRWKNKFSVRTDAVSYRMGRKVWTFVLVSFAWVFFRASDVISGINYIKRIFVQWDPWSLFDGTIYKLGLEQKQVSVLSIALLVLFVVEIIKYVKKEDIVEFLSKQGVVFRWMVMVLLLIMVIIFGQYGGEFNASNFIYSQF